MDPIGPKSVFGMSCKPFKRMAGTTRLELATSAVTGQRSNQLNYVPSLFQEVDGMKLAFADKLLRDGPATQSISPRSVKLS